MSRRTPNRWFPLVALPPLLVVPGCALNWLTDPQRVEPGSAMPDLGVSPIDVQDIAAYLYTLD
ncbi:c-type cytochrome [Micromonospora chersina]|uniref:c-type cytochrome n=1 Tax=Micromonospora chersina TaxID=47854 RepID=UPI0036772097